jgi:hypothetical protein
MVDEEVRRRMEAWSPNSKTGGVSMLNTSIEVSNATCIMPGETMQDCKLATDNVNTVAASDTTPSEVCPNWKVV